MNKTHTKNGITFNHVGRGRWKFEGVGKSGLAFSKTDIVNGLDNAERIASQLAGSLKRSDGIDGLARKHIETILAPTAKRYTGINFERRGFHYN